MTLNNHHNSVLFILIIITIILNFNYIQTKKATILKRNYYYYSTFKSTHTHHLLILLLFLRIIFFIIITSFHTRLHKGDTHSVLYGKAIDLGFNANKHARICSGSSLVLTLYGKAQSHLQFGCHGKTFLKHDLQSS